MAWLLGGSKAAGAVSIVELLFPGRNIAATGCTPALSGGTRYMGVYLHLVPRFHIRHLQTGSFSHRCRCWCGNDTPYIRSAQGDSYTASFGELLCQTIHQLCFTPSHENIVHILERLFVLTLCRSVW